jgi:hypothetical protein
MKEIYSEIETCCGKKYKRKEEKNICIYAVG